MWFKRHHPEPVPSVIERYAKEINRVSGVLEGHLAKEKEKYGGGGDAEGPWLVGNKYSYADIAFVMWQALVGHALGKDEYDVDNFPHVKEWLGNMAKREPVKAALEIFKQVK